MKTARRISSGTEKPLPVYIQIQQTLRNAIERGVYRAGGQLPSEPELARRFSTTRATVARALQELVRDGLITRTQGRGTFVSTMPLPGAFDTTTFSFFERYIQSQGFSLRYQLVDFDEAPLNARISGMLNLSAGEPLYRMRRLRIVEDKPQALEVRYMPALTALRIEESFLAAMPLQDILMGKLGIPLVCCPTAIRIGLAREEEADILQIAAGRPVFFGVHSFVDKHDTTVVWGETVFTEDFQLCYSRSFTSQRLLGHSPQMMLDKDNSMQPAQSAE